MTATAASRIKSKICEKIRIERMVIERDGPVLPNRVNKRWPAIIFAANRTAKVPGRMIFLTVSIKTINGIKTPGVPNGTKCANMCLVCIKTPYTIKDNHKGKARVSVIARWLDLVNTYGSRPKKLLNTINLNNLTNKIDAPELACPNKTLNSLCKVVVTFIHSKDHRVCITQYKYGKNKNPSSVETQFKERL